MRGKETGRPLPHTLIQELVVE